MTLENHWKNPARENRWEQSTNCSGLSPFMESRVPPLQGSPGSRIEPSHINFPSPYPPESPSNRRSHESTSSRLFHPHEQNKDTAHHLRHPHVTHDRLHHLQQARHHHAHNERHHHGHQERHHHAHQKRDHHGQHALSQEPLHQPNYSSLQTSERLAGDPGAPPGDAFASGARVQDNGFRTKPESETPNIDAGKLLPSVRSAMERARSGGRQLSIVQIGDSHVAAGTETPEIAQGLGTSDFSHHGVVGATAMDAAKNPNSFMSGLSSKTDLVVLSFGSNDSNQHFTSGSLQHYKDTYTKMVEEVHRRAPNAAIVMVGPTDGAVSGKPHTRLPGLDAVVAAQREVAAKTGANFFDIRAHLGSISQMEGTLLAGDNLHFTRAGYRRIGRDIAEHIKGNIE